MSPTDDLLFFEEGQREHDAIFTNSPNELEGFLSECPFDNLVAGEEVGGEDGDVCAGVDVRVEVVGKVTNA